MSNARTEDEIVRDSHIEKDFLISRLRAELEQARLKEIGLFQTVMEVTAEHCKCGGAGPDDPNACDACKIYHALRPHFSEEVTR